MKWIWIVQYDGKNVDGYTATFWWKQWMMYADIASGTWQFHEWTIIRSVFTPASNTTTINIADALYSGRHLNMISQASYLLFMQTIAREKPYDEYHQQIEAFKKLSLENQQIKLNSMQIKK